MIPPNLTEPELREALGLGHEQNGVEFKGPCEMRDRILFPRIVRAMCGMANRREGGRVIVGVSDDPPRLEAVGLTETQLATWSHDHLADAVAPYVDPRIEFSLQVHAVDGRKLVLLHVSEFADQPVLCRRREEIRDGRGAVEVALREGALYIRPHGKHETREPQTGAEMRQILDLAIERGVVRFESLAKIAGLKEPQETRSDREQFKAQAEDLL